MNKHIQIEVAYALPDQQVLLSLEVEEGATIEQAIHASGILRQFSEIDLKRQKVGVFGKLRQLGDTVKAGERIEIYRSLLRDPKERRRIQAKKSS